ncbi:zf-RING_2 domain-containing protein [Cephalotus follicularis]|uniref:Zf-RING_2 domain-containing protein n=1 Tax=Cephalotus follicularis TaxID=3775 RepID=A0A1Q3BNK1_CEPFO|nr:zf-RING_2 domain-containing protein [Cephalotus follicularis]
MENAPTIIGPPAPFPAPPRSVDLSSLEFILALVALITIPALIYTFFFSIRCPPNPFRRRDRGLHESDNNEESTSEVERISGVKYQKEAHVKDIGIECPVCLSVFADGEDVRQLSVCKHSFHASCIDMWLTSHSSCPICRASVPLKTPNADQQQDLPLAVTLV